MSYFFDDSVVCRLIRSSRYNFFYVCHLTGYSVGWQMLYCNYLMAPCGNVIRGTVSVWSLCLYRPSISQRSRLSCRLFRGGGGRVTNGMPSSPWAHRQPIGSQRRRTLVKSPRKGCPSLRRFIGSLVTPDGSIFITFEVSVCVGKHGNHPGAWKQKVISWEAHSTSREY